MRMTSPRLVALVAIMAIVPVARLPGFPLAGAVALGLVALWRWVAGREGGALMGRRTRLALAALGGIGTIFLLHQVARGGPAPLVSLLVLVALAQTLSLLREQGPFTTFLELLLSTVHVAGAAFLLQDAGALALTAVYLVGLTWALVVFERHTAGGRLERERGAVRRLRIGPAGTAPGGAVFRSVVALAICGFVGGLVLYAIVPREPFARGDRTRATNAGKDAPDEGVVGILDDEEAFGALTGPGAKGLKLGDIARIKRDLSPYFEVELPPGHYPWLRENTYDVYSVDESDWAPFDGEGVRATWAARPRRGAGGWIPLEREEDPVRGFDIRMRLLRGPHKRLYLPRDPVRVRVLRGGRSIRTALWVHDNRQIDSQYPLIVDDVIECRSVPPVSDPNALERARSDADVCPRPSYLVLPPECQPLVPLAHSIVGSETNPWRRARLLYQWLRSDEFTYTLAMPELDSRRPLLDFLLRTRRGHCRYYAASMTLMLRALGHPARIVKGFRGGDWQQGRQKWVVRGSHYHAWSEIYLSGLGWIPLDPTPPDREAVDAETITRVADNASGGDDRRSWVAVVLGWGKAERQALGIAIGDLLERWVVRPLAFLFGPRGYYAGFGFVAALTLVLFGRRRRKRQAQAAGYQGRRLPRGPYGRALHLLARRGLRRRAPDTAREFSTSVGRLVPAASEALSWLTRLHEDERYGGRPPAAEDLAAADRHLEALSAATTHRKER